MPKILIKGVGTATFPDEMSREEIQEAIQKNFAPQIAAIKEEQRRREFEEAREEAQQKADEQGFVTSFIQGIGQAKDDFVLGKTLLELSHGQAKRLLEKEYQKWKTTPQADEASLLSARGFGNVLGQAGVTIAPTIGAGVGATALTTPLGGLITAGATASSIQATSAKGATFRNDYINLRHQQDMAGTPDLNAAYETARDTSNKSAVIAGGIAIASTAVPVGKFVPMGSSVSGTVAKKVGAEVAFDSGLGAAESLASDVYAESQGVERGNIWENALKSAAAETLVGGPFSAFRSKGYWDEAVQQRQQRIIDEKKAERQRQVSDIGPEAANQLTPREQELAFLQQTLPSERQRIDESDVAIRTDEIVQRIEDVGGAEAVNTPRQTPEQEELSYYQRNLVREDVPLAFDKEGRTPDDAPTPMILGGPIIDPKTGKVLNPDILPTQETALLDENGNVIDLARPRVRSEHWCKPSWD
jgi:hypothetical protein